MKGNSPLFDNQPKQNGSNSSRPTGLKSIRKPIFDNDGHITLQSVSERREFFLGKSAILLLKILLKYGYKAEIHDSNVHGSKARIIIILNNSAKRNITQVQVTPKGRRHGPIPYVKISTSDYGTIKIIGSKPDDYKTDGTEKSHLLFRRK